MSPAVSSPVPSLHGPPVVFDVAIGSPPNVPPTMTILGPTLAPLELAGRKLLALFVAEIQSEQHDSGALLEAAER